MPAAVNSATTVAQSTGFSNISNQSIIASTQLMASINAMGEALQQKNEDAEKLRQMKDLATALDGLRNNGAIKLTKLDASQNEVVDVEKVQYLLDYIKLNNQIYRNDPGNQITAFDSGNAQASGITVANLNAFDLKINGISLFSKETASAALSSLGNQITAKLGLIEKDTIELNKLGNGYKNLVDLSAAMISMLTKIMDNILQRM